MFDDEIHGPQFGSTRLGAAVISGLAAGSVGLISAKSPELGATLALGWPAMELVRSNLNKWSEEKTASLVRAASEASGMGVDQFLESVQADKESLLQFGLAIEAACRTAYKEKVSALGTAVGNYAKDGAKVDSEPIWIGIISQIEVPHVRIVQALSGSTLRGEIIEKDVDAVGESLGLGRTVVPLLETLVRCGLVEERVPNVNANAVRVTSPIRSFGSTTSQNLTYTAGSLASELLSRLGAGEEFSKR
jgi:hypothetical protein